MFFNNIQAFEQRMVQQNVAVAFFTIQYHNCAIETAYSKAQKKFLFAFVDHNLGFTCSLEGSNANGFINHYEAVEQLAACRNHSVFDPIHFYEFLDAQLPHVAFGEISKREYLRVVGKAVSNFEDRIYFNHWRNANISDKQEKKALELMGYEVVKFCKDNKLTPVFYPNPTERTLEAFGDFKADFKVNGLTQ
ncbi:hypothetical protein BCT47_00270 [Vibrio splendidus]|uniref:Uncharacterized protein n=1 Tax=Vibrio splendidus TaxID=29497 RepID=A0AB35MWT5_VIBSP|nr:MULTISPECIES: hypothetical protein [Vibrio]MDP2500743.1 hypothetical protein [Vibrio splendidus]PMG52723.1 hypothetical protein BCU88_21970 [Vibrio splendidus]PMH60256.1 hypothetical protein BCU64_19300 [Vibrio lentus]PMM77904.1 hypothetical protein BCT47_00270 [Vibrio splendidus]